MSTEIKKLRLLTENDIAHKLEGLRFSLLRASFEFDALTCKLREVETRNPLSITFEEAFSVLGRCWSIIDCAERATRLARAIPFKGRSKESRDILRDLDKIREPRNDYQHLDKNATRFPPDSPPIMGALSWQSQSTPLTYLTLHLSSGSMKSSFFGLVLDREEMRFTRDFEFNAFGRTTSVSEVATLCRRYFELVEDGLEKSGMLTDDIVSPLLFGATISIPTRKQE